MAKIGYWLPIHKVVVSNWLKDKLKLKNAIVIPNGVSSDEFFNEEKEKSKKIRFGVIYSQDPIKGFNLISSVFSSLNSLYNGRFDLKIFSKVANLDFDFDFSLINPTDGVSIAGFYREIDVFIFPSLVEGFGLPPLEAMASGTVVISSTCGGVSEYLDSENALLFSPGDKEMLKQILISIIEGEINLESFSEKGLKTATKFTLENTLSRYKEIVELTTK
jgi:glycosyltransferase involved in cell wall biosynthesis